LRAARGARARRDARRAARPRARAARAARRARRDARARLGGSGNGEAIVANRVKGVRCGLCWNEQVAIWNRSHNDANVLSLGQRTVTEAEALHIVKVWLATPFEGGRHVARINKIDAA
jgi:ribose 5-phosphate isomerase B